MRPDLNSALANSRPSTPPIARTLDPDSRILGANSGSDTFKLCHPKQAFQISITCKIGITTYSVPTRGVVRGPLSTPLSVFTLFLFLQCPSQPGSDLQGPNSCARKMYIPTGWEGFQSGLFSKDPST